jgi:hypothetical protein
MLESERAFLAALSSEIADTIAGMNYREAKACGIGGAQLHALKHGQSPNFTALTILRIARLRDDEPSKFLASVEARITRSH